MKKIIYSLMAIVMTALTLTSCEKVPMPYDKPGDGDKPAVIDPKGTGTADDPFNVAAAIKKCKETGQTATTEEYYVKGVVKSIDASGVSQYGNVNIDMIDEGGKDVFKAFQILYMKGAKFTDETAAKIKEGDVIVVKGRLVNYSGNTPETEGKGSARVVSVNGQGEEGGDEPGDPTGTGTKDDPYNVAAALKVCEKLQKSSTSASYLSEEVYVKGKIASITDKELSSYGNITYYISDDGKEANQLEVYRGMSFNGEKFKAIDDIKAGDEVVIVGKLQNWLGTYEFTQGSQLYSLNGKTPEEPTPGGEAGTGTQEDPFNVAAAIAKCKQTGETATAEEYYVKGVVKTIDASGATQYGNINIDMVDEGADAIFKAFQIVSFGGKKFTAETAASTVKTGDVIVVKGKLVNYKGNTPETEGKGASQLVTVNGKSEEDGGEEEEEEEPVIPTGDNLIANGDFEAWSGSTPTNWKSACSASNATLAQSTDAHGGNYSVAVKNGTTTNKRLAYKELELEAGTYTFSLYAKATSENAVQTRLGYVPLTDGKVGSYVYGEYENLTTEWAQYSYELTLDAKTTVCIVVMNPKKSDKSSGEDILIDDASLVKKTVAAKKAAVRRK